MFVLPNVLSASIVSITVIEVVLSFPVFISELTEILNMILCYKSYLSCCMLSHIYITCINIYSYISVHENYFLTFLSICSVSEDAYVNVNSLYINLM